jgi:phenylacetate-coenzyme A ligase PaaK-like adenylate-forming protein
MKFKVGDIVRVATNSGKCTWNPEGLMDRTLGRSGEIIWLEEVGA